MSTLSIGILDDHALFRAGIKEIIYSYSSHHLSISVESSEELFKELEKFSIDVLLLDIKLKNANGIDIFKTLKKKYPKIKVIVLTMHEENVFVHHFVKEGVNGFLLKDALPKLLIETIENVVLQGKYFDGRVANILAEKIQTINQIKEDNFEITNIEIAILRFLAEGKKANEIGELLFKSKRTIEGYKQKLMKDTNSNNMVELIAWAYKKNLIHQS